MHSIQELYRIGHGPSSSHAVGPGQAALYFSTQYPTAKKPRSPCMLRLPIPAKVI